MSTTEQLSEVLRDILAHPRGGIVGLVDQLLAFCVEHGLQLDCQADCWRFRSQDSDWEEMGDFKIGKSVFRAMLARLSALCNERAPNSVSPYGGKCDLSLGNRASTIGVTFVNMPEIQQFELTTSAGDGK